MRLPNGAAFPPGELRAVYLHWSGGTYTDAWDAYHFCVVDDRAGRPEAIATHDLAANMRDVRAGGAYAAHTLGRNSFAAGIGICAMRDATPADFGAWPLREDQVELACALAAALCARYALPVADVRTHAEAALDDGYFGCGDELRWDIARLHPSDVPLVPDDALATGARLRARIEACLRAGA